MRIAKYFHSCLIIEDKNQRLLIDPGLFSFIEGKIKPQDFGKVDFVLITHAHPDHYDLNALRVLVEVNPEIKILSNNTVAKILEENGLRCEVFDSGSRELGSFNVEAFFAEHAAIDISKVENTAFVINQKILICGDSLDYSLIEHRVETIAVPITHPGTTIPMFMDFVRAYKPKNLIPVHDGYIKDFWVERIYPRYVQQFREQGIIFHLLPGPADFVEI